MKFTRWLSSRHSLAPFSAIDGSKLRTSGFFVPQYSEYTVTVENSKPGWVIPETDGVGTFGFTLIGIVLMGVAVLLYVFRRKKSNV
ncbi:LPXTG cell wall anchor domain-containing protein [Anaerobacillus sp. 1_MG-2023]|uniref:LPXTG cell wall anchor domain-containing protein n=1 Tax=Anaerobacillus sp. 1_MG-2023 TaxID=3062655 RepID=UPI0026E26DC3|nr:LPXTG cell wall anchor domain-containing protein [Anaerobacillus sp. 1_MG-2023]MDO6658717.1 LPXTG cell wall anchor domain-containing protein [Anaerobacillus sp. 1_MG-2023]